MIASMKTSPMRSLSALVLASLATACSSSREAVMIADYGTFTRDVTTTSRVAQSWVDQGFQLMYGFNHEEGILSFQEAARADPGCAMAHWGIAYGNGVDVNNMMVSDAEAEMGYEAAQRALALIDWASPAEQALIRAVVKRAVWPLPEDRKPLDEAYAEAMGEAWAAFPNDADVGALYAESLMNLQPWDYWTVEGEPLQRAEEVVDVLENVLAFAPNHPGANHFYIHAVEASSDPARARASADRLRTLVPGSGHLVHMPSHIYINTGDYDLAAEVNLEAIAADEAYFELIGEPGWYSLYFVHNIHFLAYAAMMEGRSELALESVRKMEAEVPDAFVEGSPEYADGMLSAVFHVLLRFGRWDEVLAEPDYPEFRLASRTMRHYARTIALANLGRTEEARAEFALFDEVLAQVPETWHVGVNEAHIVYPIARDMARGEILWHEGNQQEAYAALRAAMAAEDALVYDEPPGWMLPVRHALGALLLAGGEAKQAEQVYREDLEEWPRNAWSLLGLSQSLEMQGRADEAAALKPALDHAWRLADVSPGASCYCALPPSM